MTPSPSPLGSKENKDMTKQQKIIKEELQEAQYIGEDGGMVVDGRFTPEDAYKMMVTKIREEEAENFTDWCNPEDIVSGWLHLTTEEDRRDRFDSDTEWYVSIRDKSPYSVWVYWG